MKFDLRSKAFLPAGGPAQRDRGPYKTKATAPLAFLGFALFSASFFLAPQASGAIIKTQNAQACNVIGLDSSPATARGGVHCTTGDEGFSLTSILNGTIALYVGNSATPSWNIVNDTGATVTSLTLYYSGALASNSNLDMQQSNNIFTSCAATTATNVTTSSSNCGASGDTANNPALAVKLVWSGGSLAAGATFNLGTASFAHAGQDAGCISGTSNCAASTIPELSTYVLLGTGLLGIGLFKRKRFFKATPFTTSA